ncbi:vacuolar sorting-associated protein [Raphidocelis subcapitata]|uniref:Vacuolar sorting-associated protein n=1 Tax=Raphidocelis subcapitata TaxID=307507 RepID=A0A2V0P0A2_9CHLO|nr:vacuolar sorting-associated protein [Raphidocelis subcapitata]|eukprot:GBF91273.1 vacuolar sorting-associated protein [Raphidocelis subcapitata]
MKNILGLVQAAPCRIDVAFRDEAGAEYKRTAVVKGKGTETEELPLYTNHDGVFGEVRITPLTTKRVEHSGIKVQLIGQIELASERGTYHDFISLVRELTPPSDIASAASRPLPFEFRNVEMAYDSYRGLQVRCRYLLRVTVTGKGMVADTKKDFPFWVRNYDVHEEEAPPIKMEVGIEDCLHIEFEYDRAKYHLKDVVVGKIYFLLVRIKLKHMELEIRRRETTGAGTSAHNESETIAKYEIMDGAPVRGESIPIRLYLSPYDLTPTYASVHNKFSVRYFLNLVLVDEEDRRYFKQQEITLFRRAEDAAGTAPAAAVRPPSLLTSTSAAAPAAAAAAEAPAAPAAAPAAAAAAEPPAAPAAPAPAAAVPAPAAAAAAAPATPPAAAAAGASGNPLLDGGSSGGGGGGGGGGSDAAAAGDGEAAVVKAAGDDGAVLLAAASSVHEA